MQSDKERCKRVFASLSPTKEKQATQSGICFSKRKSLISLDYITSKRPMQSDKERYKRVFASLLPTKEKQAAV